MMSATEHEALAAELEAHMRTLRHASTQALAIEWMKGAYNLMARAADDLKRPRVFAVPGHFGVPIFMLTPPKALELPPAGFVKPGPVWLGGRTVVYGDKYQNKAWTRKDTVRLEREIAAKRGA